VTRRREGRAWQQLPTLTEPAQQGRKEGEGEKKSAGQWEEMASRPTGPKGGRGKEKKFSFSNLIFQIQFQLFFNLF
jgi:hypothetical protein